ncbi:hypothetical protein [Sessilibacter sp. MAH4]
MCQDQFDKNTSINLSLGHLIVLWNLISDKLSGTPQNETFSEEEKRAIWALEDLCEKELLAHGYGAKPYEEWDSLIAKAKEYCKALPAEFLE